MSIRFYRPELDALRFFSFGCVFIAHLPLRDEWFEQSHEVGAAGLCMFFLLSAYLIVSILLREKEVSGTVRLGAFAARRILRIWPLYFVVLITAYCIGRHWTTTRVPGRAVLAFSFLLGNLYVVRHGWIRGTVNPLWSLSVEEQFYLVIPAVTRLGGRPGLIGACVATVLASYAMLGWLGAHQAIPALTVWANSFVQFQFFAAGGWIALLLSHRKLSLHPLLRLLLGCVGLFLWWSSMLRFQLLSTNSSHAGQLLCGYLLLLIGTTSLFLAALDAPMRMPAPIVYLGKISYGLYLFHQFWIWFVFDLAKRWSWMHAVAAHEWLETLLAIAGTVGSAVLCYHFFEGPILKFKQRFETIQTRPV